MKNLITQVYIKLKRAYRATLNTAKFQEILWEDLKKSFKDTKYRYGVYEEEKCVEAVFDLSKNHMASYNYNLYDGYYCCRVKILESFPPELATEIFVLASHFNNILGYGIVRTNTHEGYVEYVLKNDYVTNVIFPGEMQELLLRHYRVSLDLYDAFQKLVTDREEPAFIIADFLVEYERRRGQ